jgi:hypothetical protein
MSFKERRAAKKNNENAPEFVVKTSSVGDTLLVDAKIEGRWCKCVVDTGSNITIVRPDVIELRSGKILPTEFYQQSYWRNCTCARTR